MKNFIINNKRLIVVTSVCFVAIILAFIGVVAIKDRNKGVRVTAEETADSSSDEQKSTTAAVQTLSVVETEAQTVTEAETQTEAETEAVKEEVVEITYEEIIQSAEENQVIEVMDVEEMEITEDTSEEEHVAEEVVDETKEETVSLDNFEVSQLVHGIDVSKWQGNIDWSKVANSGVTFAIIKCGGRDTGDGSLYEDSKFERNIQGALANGIQVGIYFFSQATSVQEAYEEASYCIHLIEKYQITYPVAFDWESASGYRVDNANVSNEVVTQCADTFCSVVASHGYQPMVYFCRNDWYNRVDGEYLSSKYKTWLAVYFSSHYYTDKRWEYGEDLPSFKYGFQMWQYGVTNDVDGIDGYVDMNIAFFTYSNYSVNGLQEPEIKVDKSEITTYCCPGTERQQYDDLLEGVKGVNSIGYDTEVSYKILDVKGNVIEDEEEVFENPGDYIVKYSMQDPKKGLITKDVKLKVVPINVEFGFPETFKIVDGKLPEGFSFMEDTVVVDEFGNTAEFVKARVRELFIYDDIIVDTEIISIEDGLTMEYRNASDRRYRVEYFYNLPKLGEIRKLVYMEHVTNEVLEKAQ